MSGIPLTARIAVIGAGTMGAGIAQVAARAGHPVVLFDTAPGVAVAAIRQIENSLSREVERGRLRSDQSAQIIANIQACDRADGLSVLRGSALIIEAVVEKLEIKKLLFQELDTIVGNDVILATNTSSLSITEIAHRVKNPGRVIGFHFFNPAPAMKLVEVVRGLETDQQICDQLVELASAWGKVAVVARSTPGFIVNRIARPFYAEALRAIELSVAQAVVIDAVFTAAGFRMGPCKLMDIIGLDVNYAVTESVYAGFYADARYRPSPLQREMVAAGWLGRKSGRGFYQYDDEFADNKTASETSANDPLAGTVPAKPMPIHRLPEPAQCHGHFDILKPLIARLGSRLDTENRLPETASDFVNAVDDEGYFTVANVRIQLTDGRPALQIANQTNVATVVFDLVSDYSTCQAVAMAASDDAALEIGAALFQAAGIQVIRLEDHPGLLVMRTVALLANEAFDAVATGVASADDIDKAMTLGVNYPVGPIAWARRIGLARVLSVITALGRLHEPDRYRVSYGLRRETWAHNLKTPNLEEAQISDARF